MTDTERLNHCSSILRAIRVLRWCVGWPKGHPDAPNRPAYVREFEDKHGEAPASAERVLAEFDKRGDK